ncbi:hypothetical protein [Bradyrhizobium vignae]|uniref:hypothetical protein n=1 Tax=Bradyrhizobium vignae TaxID=1549949 RepID=UPI00100BC753|nr:hypothetical protein [Bradyrhizobium vignae]RXG84475.1 hypothetical protein EAV90_37095 [Bradyrhizobium vignae]
MLALLLNIVVLLIGVGGAIVSSLTLSNTVWRTRAVIMFAVMGLIGLILTIVGYEKTPDVSNIANLVFDLAIAFRIFAQNNPWTWPILLLVWGIIFLISRFSTRKKVDVTPRVRAWLDVLAAIEQFANPELVSQWKRLRDDVDKLPEWKRKIDTNTRTLDSISKALDQDDMSPARARALYSMQKSIADERRYAIDRLDNAGEEARQKENEVLADIVTQLKRGALVGRGFRQRLDEVADYTEIIPFDHWQLLDFQLCDPKKQIVEGGGKRYLGLQIGWNENPPPPDQIVVDRSRPPYMDPPVPRP